MALRFTSCRPRAWHYGGATIRQQADGFQVTVDVPGLDTPVRVGPLHEDMAKAMQWIDDTQAEMARAHEQDEVLE